MTSKNKGNKSTKELEIVNKKLQKEKESVKKDEYLLNYQKLKALNDRLVFILILIFE
jgi:hypothetical protein